jgi:hypothetical protein
MHQQKPEAIAQAIHDVFEEVKQRKPIMIARKLISGSECREISKLRVTPESQTIQK